MHAAINSSIEDFVERLREAAEGALRICQARDVAVHGEIKVVSAEEEFQRVT